ncbi:MAG: 30S ribosomal protein S4e [Candidatus Micrarchaeia archaeon]
MAKKGGSSHLKRVAVPRAVHIKRKTTVWSAKPVAGPHRAEEAIPLISVVRDILQLADNAQEAKTIIKTGSILVDGRRVKSVNFPVGLMDIISVPALDKYYRVTIDKKGRLKLDEIKKDDASFKLCRIERKITGKGGVILLGLHDGRSQIADNTYHVGDTLKISIPQQKIIAKYALEPGMRCLITGGKHTGDFAIIEEVLRGTQTRESETKLKTENSTFTTVTRYVFTVGDAL